MAEPKRGLASWLHVPQTAVATAAASAAATTATATACADASATSPLDISVAIQRAKDAISRISPDKRALVEEIDEDPDDAEFDEKAHWGRRCSAATARRAKHKAGSRSNKAKQAPPGYSIKAFCTTKPDASTATATIVQELETALEFVPESAEEHSEDLSADASISTHATAAADELMRSLDEPESAASVSSSVSSPVDTVGSATTKSTSLLTVLATATSCVIETETTPLLSASGRPKRQAVLRTQVSSAARLALEATASIDLRTPPRKKVTAAAKRAMAAADSTKLNCLELVPPTASSSSSSSGRKRKLEMDRSGSTPAKAKAKADAFFLSDDAKRQLQEIEAVAQLREQLRATRERDLAFFRGKTGVNPFFAPAAATLTRTMSSTSSAEDDVDAIAIDDEGNGSATPGSSERVRRTRWTTHVAPFPAVQHVVSTVVGDTKADDVEQSLPLLQIATKRLVVDIVDDPVDDRADRITALRLSSGMSQHVHAEATLSDAFWFRQYVDSRDGDDQHQLPLTLQFPSEWGDETAVVDRIVELFHMHEPRVRELLASLDAARTKRSRKAANLSLVDRFTPVCASGVVGNKDALRLLGAWLSAWKSGGSSSGAGSGSSSRRSCFAQELCAFEGDSSDDDSDDGDGLDHLYRVFVLEGESSAGKSAAVYACADELGYNVIEINAGQSRAGRHIAELAGEATQSTRVLHVGGGGDKSKSKHKSKKHAKKRSRKSLDTPATAAHLSLVLFEDVDVVFDEDKGFYASLCSIAKHSKCPIVLTCRALPDHFPAAPPRLHQVLTRPSVPEFSAWMLLVAHLEMLPLAPALVESLAHFFRCDLRQALHFVESHMSQLVQRQRAAIWTWRSAPSTSDNSTVVVVDDDDDDDDTSSLQPRAAPIVVPAWTHYPTRAFDLLSNSLLPELAAVVQVPEEDKSVCDKVADTQLLESLALTLDAVSIADVWRSRLDADNDDVFFDRERDHLRALDVRAAGLAAFVTPDSRGAAALQSRASATLSSTAADGVRRSLDAALAEQQRTARSRALRSLQSKLDLPLAALGAGDASARFALDYMPMLGRIGNSSTSHQPSRRRASRRHHYLSSVIADMSLLDELQAFTTFAHAVDSDQIVAASPLSSPLAS